MWLRLSWYPDTLMLSTVLLLLLLAPGDSRQDADALFRDGRFREAASAYLELVRASPDDTSLLQVTGESLLRAGNANGAIPFFQRVLTISPVNIAGLQGLATCFEAIGEFGQTQTLLTKLTELEPDSESWYRLAEFRYRTGYYAAAIDGFERALDKGFSGPAAGPLRNRAEILHAISLVETGRQEQAAVLLPRLLERPENSADLDLRLSYARLLYETGQNSEALKQDDAAAGIDRNNAAVHFWRARILLAQGQTQDSVKEAELARDLSPNSPAPRSLLVRLYQRIGRTEDAGREAGWLHEHEGQVGRP
jgi:tetratricopeptide (TPR) repeat protein